MDAQIQSELMSDNSEVFNVTFETGGAKVTIGCRDQAAADELHAVLCDKAVFATVDVA